MNIVEGPAKFLYKKTQVCDFSESLKMSGTQTGTLYQSGKNYPGNNTVTRSGNFYFSFEGDSYKIITALGNQIYLFSSPQESFNF